MAQNSVSAGTAIVTGVGRGFGLAIAAALADAGIEVVGVARDPERLKAVAGDLGGSFVPVVGDVTDPDLPGRLLASYRPGLVVLNAGAVPDVRPLYRHTWETFSQVWETDVRQAFSWCGEALRAPLAPGSTVIAVSSMAALGGGSPLSGGYAGAKATVRFIASYAAQESDLAGAGIRFLTLMPNLTAATRLGAAGVGGYAERQGVSVAEFVRQRGEQLRPEQVARAVLAMREGDAPNGSAFTLVAQGLNLVK
ncbi:MAG: SDR family oxidoreductase [Catenulispora sp.]